MTPKQADELKRLIAQVRQGRVHIDALEDAIDSLTQDAQPSKPLSYERISKLVDTCVGGPSPSYPLDQSSWIDFTRAVEAAHGIKEQS